ncbi:MAG TPA: rhomboid-like protein [Streptosporangiaceae bacterium]
MTPRGPIGREQAGPPAGQPDGALGGCPIQVGPPSPAPAPGSATSGIFHRMIDPQIATVHDVAVSYGLLALAGTLTGRVPARWRAWYATAIGGSSLGVLAISRDPTDVGHVLAAIVGLVLAVVLLRAVAFASARSDSL